ncbi:unnamed protein product [Cunninghamella blakesleeana]
MIRRHSAGDTSVSQSTRLPVYPPSTPDHNCAFFIAPEGAYNLAYKIFFRSLAPYYTVGTTASLVSIKYKETTPSSINRYEPQPGARNYRRFKFGNIDVNNINDNDDINITASTTTLGSTVLMEEDLSTLTNSTITNTYPLSTPTSPITNEHNLQKRMTIPSTGYHDLSSNNTPTSSVPFSPTSISSYFNNNVNNNNNNNTVSNNSNNNSNSNTFLPQPTSRSYSSSSSSTARKPKTNITKTNSSFVQKIITNGQLAKILVERTSEDTNLFYNCGSSFVWMDAACKPMEPLSRIIFNRAFPTSHDVNLLTRGSDHLDIIIGFTSGDIIWFDPLCNKYGRINKGGVMNSSSITMIRWIQGSENLFMAAFQDGSIMIFDKEKEDELFNPNDHDKNVSISNNNATTSSSSNHWNYHHSKHTFPSQQQQQPSIDKNHSKQSIPKQTFRITKPSTKISTKYNPVAHWKLSNQSITAFSFSPDCQHVAVVGSDGYMRVINFVNEKLLDVYESYYGGLLCVSWSPDGRYILAGGQDDLVTIWAFREQRIIARCQGHNSWVTSVAFDPWRCDERVYRFASVGEDAKLILWDFSVPALHLPKTRVNTRHRGASVSSMTNGNVLQTVLDRPTTLHPVVSKTEVAILQPTVVKTIHADPCVGVYFREDAIITTDKRGRVCVWKRPS